ncbi:MAG: RidA family protein [Planctomycetaceae bacterium]|nr:RidA family protein [Planctomycetaceae bacterium]
MTDITAQPIPQGRYIPAVRHADIIYTSGMTPRQAGELKYTGPVGVDDDLELHREPVELAATNALVAAGNCLRKDERISLVLQLNVFINASRGFTAHAALANFASNVVTERLGECCLGARAAIGVASLPGDAPVEITLVAAVAP